MTTINYKVFKHHLKEDGTYNVKFVITKNRKRSYVPSTHHVSNKQLVKTTYKLKDPMVVDALNIEVANLRKKITELGAIEKNMTLDEIVAYLFKASDDSGDRINFISFCRNYIQSVKDEGREGSVGGIRAALNNFVDFVGHDEVTPGDITSAELSRFEAYLRKDRMQRRDSGQGSWTLTKAKGLDSTGVYNMMNHFRVLFNACRKHYNTESRTVITNYPFDFYKMPKLQRANKKKKGGELTIDDIVRISRMDALTGSRTELARDVWMLSFLLCGMNAKDIFDYDGPVNGARLEYERSKTADRRSDRAFFSVKIPDEARAMLERWDYKRLHRRFMAYSNFIKAVCLGVDVIGNGNYKTVKSEKHRIEGLNLPFLTFYHARHTFATLAHKECGYSVEQIARVLNHVDQQHKVTERYIDTDWSIVDKVQGSVLQLFRQCAGK